MNVKKRLVGQVLVTLLVLAGLVACTSGGTGSSASSASTTTAGTGAGQASGADKVPAGFTSRFGKLPDFTMHYVIGGRGDPVVLIHGFPLTWNEWADQMPALAQKHTVITVDLRGAGQSGVPASGYDADTLAGDVHTLLQKLGMNSQIQIVAHDVGVNVAYAYAAQWRSEVRQMVVMEAPVPDQGIYHLPALNPGGKPSVWHFGLFQLPLAQQLITGHEENFIRGFIGEFLAKGDQDAFTDVQYQYYAGFLKQPQRLHAWLQIYRALPQDVTENARSLNEGKLAMPILAIGADQSFGAKVGQQWSKYASNVQFHMLTGCGHWVTEEKPDQVTQLVSGFLV